MAISFASSGDRWNHNSSSLPKNFVASRWVGGAAGVPAVGQLCKVDATAGFDDGVVQCVASDVPLYYIHSVNSSNGTLSVYRLPKVTQAVFPYVGTMDVGTLVRGAQIQANGTVGTIAVGGILRDAVKAVASGGTGTIIRIYPTTGGAGLLVVEFGT